MQVKTNVKAGQTVGNNSVTQSNNSTIMVTQTNTSTIGAPAPE